MRSKTTAAVASVIVLASIPLLAWALGGPAASPVRLESPAWREIRPSVFASGQFVHGDSVRVTSEVIGRVTAVHVAEGQRVAQGDLLLEIDSEAYAAQVAHHEAAVRRQEADLERKRLAIERLASQHRRTEELHRAGLLGAEAYEQAFHGWRLAQVDGVSSREALNQARAALAQSVDQRDKTRVVAPLAGVVASLEIEAGETAIAGTTNIPGSVLAEVADPDSMLAEVYVDEADVAGIRIGDDAAIVAAAYADVPLAGTVAFIASTAKFRPNSRSRAFRIRIALADRGQAPLRAGMSCRAEVFLAPAADVLSIPIAAVLSDDQPGGGETRHFVYVTADAGNGESPSPVRGVEVELGRADDEFQEAVGGLTADDLIVVGPSRTLRGLQDGDRVVAAAQ